MKYLKIVFAFAILCSAYQAKCQSNYSGTMSKLESDYQKCMDDAENTLGCSQQYYQQLDGLLQEILKDAKTKLKPNQRATFRTEQTAWMQKKDAFFKQIPASVKENNEDLKGADLQAAVLDKKSEFLMERINELMQVQVDTGE